MSERDDWTYINELEGRLARQANDALKLSELLVEAQSKLDVAVRVRDLAENVATERLAEIEKLQSRLHDLQTRFDAVWKRADQLDAMVGERDGKLNDLSLRLDQALETNRELNRRCQVYESAASQKIEDAKREGVSLSKRFARAGYTMAEERAKELESELGAIRELVGRDGYQAKNGGNGGRQFLEALQSLLVVEIGAQICGQAYENPVGSPFKTCRRKLGHTGNCSSV